MQPIIRRTITLTITESWTITWQDGHETSWQETREVAWPADPEPDEPLPLITDDAESDEDTGNPDGVDVAEDKE